MCHYTEQAVLCSKAVGWQKENIVIETDIRDKLWNLTSDLFLGENVVLVLAQSQNLTNLSW